MKKSILAVLLSALFTFPVLAAVDVNRASQSQLEAIKGIGPAKAKAIIEYRDKHGAFKNLEDLANVKGFGKSSVAKLKGQLSVDGKSEEMPKAGGKGK